jgi:hypothetical protein
VVISGLPILFKTVAVIPFSSTKIKIAVIGKPIVMEIKIKNTEQGISKDEVKKSTILKILP